MDLLDVDIRNVGGIGAKKAELLNKLGLFTLRDCVEYFPRSYEDRSMFSTISAAVLGENVCIRAIVGDEPSFSPIRLGLSVSKTRAFDSTTSIELVFFNKPHLKYQLIKGHEYTFFGKVEGNLIAKKMLNPDFEDAQRSGKTGQIMPVYTLTTGLSRSVVMQIVRTGLLAAGEIDDALPEEMRSKYGLCGITAAYNNIHFPADFAAAQTARKRVIFDEFFSFSCGLSFMTRQTNALAGIKLEAKNADEFYGLLPYTPTGAQRRAVEEAFADMCGGRAMNRLVQGDVGSGKTMVAAACMWLAAKNGKQAALMAPTELLATQHYIALEPLFAKCKIPCALLTGSTSAAEKRSIRAALKSGKIGIIIGTHALLQDSVAFSDLALCITDEQHRFGVAQRRTLAEKSIGLHTLLMSATPIPRTLALMLYGDLQVSVINELPPGRMSVPTYAVNENYRARINNFIEKQVQAGGQAYIVCPLIESDDKDDGRKSATAYAETLRKSLPNLRIELLHGKMKAAEKDDVMRRFSGGEIDALVSTTVIEVGVNVPRASLMIVEDADRFGLSQLHQLRGRVGRGDLQSYCILVSSSLQSDTVRARLKIMTQTNDGFKIAEEDLKLRGPGDFFGDMQHGLPEFKIADLASDLSVLQNAQEAANEILARDPDLANFPQIREKAIKLFGKTRA